MNFGDITLARSPQLRTTAAVHVPALRVILEKFLGFVAEDKLKKVAAVGGPSQVICNLPGPRCPEEGGGRPRLTNMLAGLARACVLRQNP